MAIDTATKRHSAMHATWAPGYPPIPSGTVDGPARATVNSIYSGITIGSLTVTLVVTVPPTAPTGVVVAVITLQLTLML